MGNEWPPTSDQLPFKPYRSIIPLLGPLPSKPKDEYKRVIPAEPLMFDRVNEGRPPKSKATLFKVPVEVLASILLYIPQESLASFALVNSDCRQLARSRQFSNVCFDYSDPCLQLGLHLDDELRERQSNNGSSVRPSLGACIRHVTVETLPSYIESRHSIRTREAMSIPIEQFRLRIFKASSLYFDKYLPAIERILSSLPHLRRLEWRDPIPVDYGFFESLIKSNIQSLKLLDIEPMWYYQLDMLKKLPTESWRLRTLYLQLSDFSEDDKPELHRYPPLSITIIRACAETLESLTWVVEGPTKSRDPPVPTYCDSTVQPFPKLRELTLIRNTWLLYPPTILHALIPPSEECLLRSLCIDPEDMVVSGLLDKRGKIPSLEQLELYNTTPGLPMDFILANDQLSKLSFRFPMSSEFMRLKLLPALSHSFNNLTSLHLTWDTDFIPRDDLEIIGAIKGLEQVWFSAGSQTGRYYDWLIDHQAMRETFLRLPKLRKFAFSRDSYLSSSSTPVERYYFERYTVEVMRATEDADQFLQGRSRHNMSFPKLCKMIWEGLHRDRMLSEAQKYIDELPNHPLEWMYFGQIPMDVKRVSGCKKAYPSFHKRDDCLTYLRKMFNWDTYDLVESDYYLGQTSNELGEDE
ncbi:hypothetical protein PVAR5_4772 [Paecilomyces variotii No. 5]|uniref:F-box domain-containing protein n=1 Tax=Byssochlamys spectabilis (strain No. 5 / NBRC 109023) TaxID=1356009 RepID=V5FVM7_BYSSN|nr:hypothetical protein PVAR5_4772 [Paecilomyces variotii No. 5]